jgi:zinc protease
LYVNHPYGVPVIGWEHEIAQLNHDDATTFYKRYYAPNNAILVVSGDVEPNDVLALAKETYGKIAANPATLRAARPTDPEFSVPRRLELVDPNAGQPLVMRYYKAPAAMKAAPREAEALDLLMKVMMSGATSRAYRQLVVEQGKASSVEGYYMGDALDYGRIVLYGVANDGVSLTDLEAAIDGVITDTINKGITQAELDRARNTYIADYVYESDNQSSLARRYGWGVANGMTIKDIEDWPKRLGAVTLDDVRQAGAKWLNERSSVTGWLRPAKEPVADASTAKKL